MQSNMWMELDLTTESLELTGMLDLSRDDSSEEEKVEDR